MKISLLAKNDLSDSALVAACLKYGERYFRLLYRRYSGKVRSTLLRVAGPDSLDDLTQEVFVRVWENLNTLRSPQYLGTWVYRVTVNVAIGFLQKRSRDLVCLNDSGENVAVNRTGPDEEVLYRALVQKALRLLSDEHRTVLVLHDLEELDEQEVASVLDVPVGTVKSRLFYARKRIRDFLTSKGIKL